MIVSPSAAMVHSYNRVLSKLHFNVKFFSITLNKTIDVRYIKYYKFIDRVSENQLKIIIPVSINRIGDF